MSLHADTIHAAVEGADGTSALFASWRRCSSVHRLDPDRAEPPERDPAGLREAREREAPLIATARPYLDLFFQAFDDPRAVACLTDRDGMVIDQATGRSHDSWRRRPAQVLGTRFTEDRVGTCGVGTCLIEDRPLIVAAGQHFLDRLTPMTGIGAPIYGPDGATIGCLSCVAPALPSDASAARDRFTLMAVTSAACRIGLELFAKAYPKAQLVYSAPIMGAAMAVDADDRIIGATRAARCVHDLTDIRLAAGLSSRDLLALPAAEDLAETEARLIARTMLRFGNNRVAVAKALGISRSTLYRKLAEIGRHADA